MNNQQEKKKYSITIEDISCSIDIFKNGGWIKHEVPAKWHEEEEDDICECCGTNFGKKKVQVVDEYKTEKEYIKPGTWNPDMILLSPEVEKSLLEEK